MNFKNNEGITLVELVVAMATSTLVFAAAVTLLLLGLRINNLTTGTTIRQNKTRTVLTVMERLATEGEITGVVKNDNSWILTGENNKVVASYDEAFQAVYYGPSTIFVEEDNKTLVVENTVHRVLEGVTASDVTLDEKNILSIVLETEDERYASSIYCRVNKVPDKSGEIFEQEILPSIKDEAQSDSADARTKFLDLLSTQYRLKGGEPNRGLILDNEGKSTGEYYSEWYITTKEGADAWGNNGWNKDTPWCACFTSWALNKVQEQEMELSGKKLLDYVPMFAEVDSFKEDFEARGKWLARFSDMRKPGDLIFFDWSMGTDPDHVGVYLKTIDGFVYTIEGNSAGMVAVRRYSVDDPRIIGYGVLNWK